MHGSAATCVDNVLGACRNGISRGIGPQADKHAQIGHVGRPTHFKRNICPRHQHNPASTRQAHKLARTSERGAAAATVSNRGGVCHLKDDAAAQCRGNGLEPQREWRARHRQIEGYDVDIERCANPVECRLGLRSCSYNLKPFPCRREARSSHRRVLRG